MPRDLFGDVTDPSVRVGSRTWYTVPLSLLGHSLVVSTIVVISLLTGGVLPVSDSGSLTLVRLALPPEPPPAARPRAPVAPRTVDVNPLAAPVEAPTEIRPETGLEAGFEAEVGGAEGGIGVVPGGIESGFPPPPPEAKPPAPPAVPVRVGGDIRMPTKVTEVAPVYPPIALAARVQGLVIVEAIIGPDGRVRDARVLRSIPLLDQAALDAVRQWQYTPTLLNGVPVAVVMTVTVAFQLQ